MKLETPTLATEVVPSETSFASNYHIPPAAASTMPVYRIREKFWWWNAAYTIQDDHDNNVYSLHRKWFAMDQAIEMKEEATMSELEQPPPEDGKETDAGDCNKETVLTIRKKLFSLGPVYEVKRKDNVVVASIQSKRVRWFQQERYVFELADVEYVVDESKWKNEKSFAIQPTQKTRNKREETIALVYKKNKLRDISGSFWVDVRVDPAYYQGEALRDMCATVLAACIIMIEIFTENDRHVLRLQQQEKRLSTRIQREEKRKAATG